jgi:ferredoxin-type protein NapH
VAPPGTKRYLLLRRTVQASVLLLFIAGNAFGWKVLQGNLSSSRFLGSVPLSDPYALLQVLFTGTLVSAEALIGGAIVLLVFAVLGGRTFCAWICPLNMVTDLAERLRISAGIDRRVPALTITRNARYWVLGLGLVLSPVLGVAAFERLSPISMLHRGLIYGMGAGWAVVAAVFLFDLFAVRQGFCGHLCPLGAFYALAGRAGVLRVAHREERCSRCERCRDICPEPQVLPLIGRESGFVSSGECTNCGRCIDVCPDDALAFGVRLQYNTTGERKGG